MWKISAVSNDMLSLDLLENICRSRILEMYSFSSEDSTSSPGEIMGRAVAGDR